MRIAILGGSFDPPHLGHLLVAGQIKKNLNIDQVWLMPAFIHPLHKQLTRAKDRMRMTKLLEGDGILASDFEIRQNKKSYTIETMRLLSAKYPNDTFFWISGSDQIKNYPKWKEWRKILENYNVIIYSRGDSKAEIEEELKKILQTKTVPNNFFILASSDLPVIDVSSTAVRQRIKEKLPIKSLVPKKVEGYIIEHKLYK